MNEIDIRKELVKISKYLHDRGFLVAADGNLSYRITESIPLPIVKTKNRGF